MRTISFTALSFATLSLLLISTQGVWASECDINPWECNVATVTQSSNNNPVNSGFTGTMVLPSKTQSNRGNSPQLDVVNSGFTGTMALPGAGSKTSASGTTSSYTTNITSGNKNVDSIIDSDPLLTPQQKAEKKLYAFELLKNINNGSSNMNGDGGSVGSSSGIGGTGGYSGTAKDHSDSSYGPGYASAPESINDYSPTNPGFTEADLPNFEEYDIEQISADKSKVEHNVPNAIPDDMKAKYDVTHNYYTDVINEMSSYDNAGLEAATNGKSGNSGTDLGKGSESWGGDGGSSDGGSGYGGTDNDAGNTGMGNGGNDSGADE